jgi:hypothetical protein
VPDNYFEIRLAIEEAPVGEGYGRLLRRAIRALDAADWAALKVIACEALEKKPCSDWYHRIERLLEDPVFRDSVSG